MWGQPQTGSEVYQNHRTYSWNAWKSGWRKHGIYSGSSVVISEKEGAKGNARCNGICTVHTILPTDIIRVDFPKLCEESVLEEGVLDEDTADWFWREKSRERSCQWCRCWCIQSQGCCDPAGDICKLPLGFGCQSWYRILLLKTGRSVVRGLLVPLGDKENLFAEILLDFKR